MIIIHGVNNDPVGRHVDRFLAGRLGWVLAAPWWRVL